MPFPVTSAVEQDCSTCRGYGELAVPGTYGPTISPEALELRECYDCNGSGVSA